MANSEEARLDEMVTETKALIDQANEVSGGLRGVLQSLGCDGSDTTHKLFQSGECPPDLREKANAEVEKVHQELAEEENRLRLTTDKPSTTASPRSGMTKI